MRGLQGGHHLFPRHRWERIEKLVDAVVSFEVVNQIPQWNSGTDEHGRPAQDVRIAVNDDGCGWHAALLLNSNLREGRREEFSEPWRH